MSDYERERRALVELLNGNIPTFLRSLQPVSIKGSDLHGNPLNWVIWVLPDYLAIGSDNDFIRIPLSLLGAKTVAKRFEMMLPTRKMVDSIYSRSSFRLKPNPLSPGPLMRSSRYALRHQNLIESTRLAMAAPLGALLAGHKKDVVLTKRLLFNPGRVAIYGWHRLNGKPIQPLSTIHGERYYDYSHGVRLISDSVQIGKKIFSLSKVLKNKSLAPLLSYEGSIEVADLL